MFFAKSQPSVRLAVLAACGLVPFYSHAQQPAPPALDRDARAFVFDVSGGIGWTDNVTRAPANAEEATLAVAGLQIVLDERRTRFDASLDASMQFYHYFDNEFEDDLLGGFAGALNFAIVPDRFEWVVQDNFGQVRTDPFDAGTPENRENFNYFTTGPDFSFRLGSASVLRLFGRYSDTRYEEVDALDGNRRSVGAALLRESAPGRGVSLNVTSERVEFGTVAQGGTEFDRHQAFLRLQGSGSRTELNLDLGYAILDDGTDESDGVVARFSMTRSMSSRSSITLGGGREFSDAGELFREVQGRSGPDLEGTRILATPDPFENTFGFFNWNFSFNRTSFGAGVDFNRERYETSVELDRDLLTYGAYIERELSERTRLRIVGRYMEEEFNNVGFKDDELQFSAAISTALGRSLTLQLQFENNERDSLNGLSDFRENRASLLLAWSPRGGR
jgi:hypothetical protein